MARVTPPVREYFDKMETRTSDAREAALLGEVQKQIAHAIASAPAYAELLADWRGATFQSLADLAALPLTRKSDLHARQQQSPPFGGLSALAAGDIRYIFASPGPIYEAVGARADAWRLARALFAAGFRAGDLVHNAFSYHLTPAGQMLDSGCHALGCGVIPGGVGQTDLQLQTMHDLQPVGYTGTPSFLKILLDKDANLTCLQKALVSGEALPKSTRAFFTARGVQTLQCYATADVGLIAYESVADAGLIVDEGVVLEIVKPGGGEPAAPGEVGEVVVTSLNPDYPLIRFATGDLSAVAPGMSECGRTNTRIKGWLGRADQTAKVRGMFIHPSQIAEVVKRHSEIKKARLVIEWIDARDVMTLHCLSDSNDAALIKNIEQSIRDVCKVRGAVKIVDDIANDGVVIEDARDFDAA